MPAALKHHWPEYLIEAAGLGMFMLSACVSTTLLAHPASPVRQALSDPVLRRILMGLAMGRMRYLARPPSSLTYAPSASLLWSSAIYSPYTAYAA
jgi:hypothetical protein